MTWVALFVAGLFEVVWALALKGSDGFSWTGTGAVGAAIAGMIFFHEAAGLARLVSIGLIAVGIVWLALAEG